MRSNSNFDDHGDRRVLSSGKNFQFLWPNRDKKVIKLKNFSICSPENQTLLLKKTFMNLFMIIDIRLSKYADR